MIAPTTRSRRLCLTFLVLLVSAQPQLLPECDQKSYSAGNNKQLQADHVMHQMHSKMLEQPARPVADIPEGPVDVKGRMGLNAAILLRSDCGRETDRPGHVPDCQLAGDNPLVRFRGRLCLRFPTVQPERGGRVAFSCKEVI